MQVRSDRSSLALAREPHCTYTSSCDSLALISRKLVDLSPDSVGTFATVFPSDHPDHPGTPTSLVSHPTCDPFVHVFHRRAVLSAGILRKVRKTSGLEFYPRAVRLMGYFELYVEQLSQ